MDQKCLYLPQRDPWKSSTCGKAEDSVMRRCWKAPEQVKATNEMLQSELNIINNLNSAFPFQAKIKPQDKPTSTARCLQEDAGFEKWHMDNSALNRKYWISLIKSLPAKSIVQNTRSALLVLPPLSLNASSIPRQGSRIEISNKCEGLWSFPAKQLSGFRITNQKLGIFPRDSLKSFTKPLRNIYLKTSKQTDRQKEKGKKRDEKNKILLLHKQVQLKWINFIYSIQLQ